MATNKRTEGESVQHASTWTLWPSWWFPQVCGTARLALTLLIGGGLLRVVEWLCGL